MVLDIVLDMVLEIVWIMVLVLEIVWIMVLVRVLWVWVPLLWMGTGKSQPLARQAARGHNLCPGVRWICHTPPK
jgi:hypothetical protein